LSAPITFFIDTKPPAVSMTALKAQINTPTPELTGKVGSEPGDIPKVQVKIYKGPAAGAEVAVEGEATISVAGKVSSWSYKSPSNLAEGTYTAQATQLDEAGNAGVSTPPVTFTIDTLPPTVTMNPPALLSNNRKPTFSGTASDLTPVTVVVYAAATGTTKVAESTSKGPATTGGTWTSSPVSPELPNVSGKHAYWVAATQTDEAGNSTTTAPRVKFVVDTEAPTVALNAPPRRMNNRTPSFSGAATDTTAVTVEIFKLEQQPVIGNCEKPGTPFATATAQGTGAGWESSPANHALPDGNYIAIAVQTSAAGNHCGETAGTFFTVDTVPPRVTTDYPGPTVTGGSVAVGGTAGTSQGDLPSVTVRLYAGEAVAEGQTPIRVHAATVAGGAWSETFAGLPPGVYTARAEQADEAGNVGVSGPRTFHLVPAGGTAPAGHPAASFSWYPAAPHVGERVSLVSSSTDATSPLTGFAWDAAGDGTFLQAGQVLSTSFASAGNHVVRLRVTDATGLSNTATETIPVGGPQAALMQPFPLVRIVTTRTSSGVRLRLLSILATRGARIVITCKGQGCPVKKQIKLAAAGKVGLASVSFARFERNLPTGITLEIRVYKAGSVGKYTRLTIRAGRVKRVDECLAPDGVKPIPCPA
jgi:Bacterial Ig-like domain/PKD domain